jgi:hypothetical protein
MIKTRISALASILTAALVYTLLSIQAAPHVNPYQTRNTHFGVSGGNVNDITHAFCCSGTLGSLVTAGGNLYILSNNHILARQDQASPGEDISQPGLVDSSCQPATIVANFTTAAHLGTTNVDAAIAQLNDSLMDASGFIEGIGTISSTIANPTVGLAVIKSGRTTGTTMGTIASTNTSVKVQYQLSCHSGKKYILTYTNQVLINSSSFSAAGDSGSLIVTNDGNFNPVALLFAGSSSTTVANPIGEVLRELTSALGSPVSFVGTATASSTRASGGQLPGIPEQAAEHAKSVLGQNRHDLMSKPAVLGVGLGVSEASNSEAAIIVYLDKTSSTKPQLPDQIDSVRVRVVSTDPFIAF